MGGEDWRTEGTVLLGRFDARVKQEDAHLSLVNSCDFLVAQKRNRINIVLVRKISGSLIEKVPQQKNTGQIKPNWP